MACCNDWRVQRHGLALVMGVLSTLLSGASYGTELGNMVDGPQAGKDGISILHQGVGVC
jgi:LDH2 family malate/lactate/ureidoglycolate dehydrogenase